MSPMDLCLQLMGYLKTIVAMSQQKRYPGSTQNSFKLYLITLW